MFGFHCDKHTNVKVIFCCVKYDSFSSVNFGTDFFSVKSLGEVYINCSNVSFGFSWKLCSIHASFRGWVGSAIE